MGNLTGSGVFGKGIVNQIRLGLQKGMGRSSTGTCHLQAFQHVFRIPKLLDCGSILSHDAQTPNGQGGFVNRCQLATGFHHTGRTVGTLQVFGQSLEQFGFEQRAIRRLEQVAQELRIFVLSVHDIRKCIKQDAQSKCPEMGFMLHFVLAKVVTCETGRKRASQSWLGQGKGCRLCIFGLRRFLLVLLGDNIRVEPRLGQQNLARGQGVGVTANTGGSQLNQSFHGQVLAFQSILFE
mmetsp:Transcript_19238/g.47567  ORF Transcript_19238/g.47567 Transcript_19238/m.47567 type:complete len:237 (+) Transcript_19238:107-817(+)